eukprot:2467536-Rhodomonas_salina.4
MLSESNDLAGPPPLVPLYEVVDFGKSRGYAADVCLPFNGLISNTCSDVPEIISKHRRHDELVSCVGLTAAMLWAD